MQTKKVPLLARAEAKNTTPKNTTSRITEATTETTEVIHI